MRYLKLAILALTAILFIVVSIADSQAGPRKGSHRVGGHGG